MAALNISARAGRWSASNWKRASFGWLFFAVAAIVLGTAVGSKSLSQAQTAVLGDRVGS